MDFSPEIVGFLIAASIFAFVVWYYLSTESKRNNFLTNRIRETNDDKVKSAKQIAIEKELENLNNPITYEKLMQLRIFAIAFSIVGSYVVNAIYLGLFFAIVSFKIPDIYIALMKDKRENAFKEHLPDAINQLLSIMQSGQTALQGYKILGKEAPYPINQEFQKLYTDYTTGAVPENALQDFYERNKSADIKLFTTGMNIAESATDAVALNTLRQISTTIRTRESQKKSAKSAIAAGKYTAIILALLPLFLFAFLMTAMTGYVGEFIATTTGKIAYAIAFLLDGIGYLVARKITSSSQIVKY